MKKFIVITSIFPPTEAVESFSEIADHKLIVVGDKKSPVNWSHSNVKFFGVSDQEAMSYVLSKKLPYNHYCRKMLGYLAAIEMGAEVIIDTDDDNIPLPNWSFPSFEDQFRALPNDSGFLNVYKLFTDAKIWPRGLPLHLIRSSNPQPQDCVVPNDPLRIAIWQGLANEDPDVDAIYRLVSDTPCFFNDDSPVVLGNGTYCPFNSQNTAFAEVAFPLLYLPTTVTFRYTDILRSYVAQPILHNFGYNIGFLKATVVQKRNPHDYMKDFESEIPMYLTADKIIDWVREAVSSGGTVFEQLESAYKFLTKKGVTEEPELDVLQAWIQDLSRFSNLAT